MAGIGDAVGGVTDLGMNADWGDADARELRKDKHWAEQNGFDPTAYTDEDE
jgi:hypothetical protein